jgi:hypothetical protein
MITFLTAAAAAAAALTAIVERDENRDENRLFHYCTKQTVTFMQ